MHFPNDALLYWFIAQIGSGGNALDWTAVVVALIALLGTGFSAYKSRTREADPATVHVQRAGLVVDIQKEEIGRLKGDLEAARIREDALEDRAAALESEVASMSRRVERLEEEVIRLGGDPALVL